MGYFLSVLKKKETPNPCLVCNRFVKFKKLIEFAQKEKIKYIATGHYAQIKEKDGEKLEPYEEVTINVPEKTSGAIIEKLSSRYGNMMNMESRNQYLFRVKKRISKK